MIDAVAHGRRAAAMMAGNSQKGPDPVLRTMLGAA
jgi:hypothetical protein